MPLFHDERGSVQDFMWNGANQRRASLCLRQVAGGRDNGEIRKVEADCFTQSNFRKQNYRKPTAGHTRLQKINNIKWT